MKNLAIIGALAATCFALPTAAQDVTFSTGVDYSEGEFGSGVDTSILVVPMSISTRFDGFSVSVSVPYLEIDGSSSVVGGGDGPIITDPNLADTKRSGIGDVSVRARYDMFDLGGVQLSASGRVKLPTGSSADRLSTGETDFSGALELAATQGAIQPFGEIGYRILGDPDGIDLQNGIYGSAGALILLPANFVAIASYDYVEASSTAIDDTHSVFGGLVIPASERLSLTTYGTLGLSESAADWGAGILLSFKLGS